MKHLDREEGNSKTILQGNYRQDGQGEQTASASLSLFKRFLLESHLSLHEDDRSILINGGWLNTALLGAVQIILKVKFNSVGALHDTMLKPWVQSPIKSNQDFVQLLHIGSNHWLMVTNIGVPLTL